jgi:ATP-binding cassette subfamily E protein 1
VREGINVFLAGFIPTENLRFREDALSFKMADNVEVKEHTKSTTTSWPALHKTLGLFSLKVEAGTFSKSQTIVMLGQNGDCFHFFCIFFVVLGTGKTTFIRMLAGVFCADDGSSVPKLNVSYKPQMLLSKFPGTVRQLLHTKIKDMYLHPNFKASVMTPLKMEDVMDLDVVTLSGGELQRVAIVLCLGKPADIYLIDEPSASLDSEQRIACAKVIKRFVLQSQKTAFVVEHDFIMATYLADQVIVYEGVPGVSCTAHKPQPLLSGMNLFLKDLEITFRRDPSNNRPRINKFQSTKDQEQKKTGTYFYLDTLDNDEETTTSNTF